jgi:hypothetical protein
LAVLRPFDATVAVTSMATATIPFAAATLLV